MAIVDRRILKSQEAIKHAFINLMSEKNFDEITMQDISDSANVGRRTIYHHYLDKYDLLDKLIEEHIHELRKLCELASDMDFIKSNLLWFEYFESHYSFFSAMLSSKGAPFFRSRFLNFVIEELEKEVNITEGNNTGLSKEVILKFFGTALVGIVESYFKKEILDSPQSIAEQVGILLDRNL
ncbi:TetR/AcrR family transcriptional regulator [Paenibacillus alba]|uniref:TetR/AcrR family transcriptional regulator n=1 Tax=Paenibacillus alba TaxID=1197127 RepID=A0ABU6FWY6_9BACL|nr:TetR/AcrR family transcriptional regulator [Paenibacillus alba]MEC0226414.1 TetR/AcrR family transcriptional regulator [Paenibacillus alba]NQX66409.1 TetR/AcrR family transcriptional regulator [Paenibacillus alba]